ncbi:hypothetical protein GCM10007385_36640 [Tateyamaria omphalii]|uniref:hypothetical protein n=1 Tax=Tateyamaria omphalii TaxID=299262 RepID=UPI001671CF58|nr:hypothetical protein [Tateyamaria omphalii]GGX64097.1 hypothetical protein GCM10007385_36640 [Tateyamaria omphalii]
MANAYFLNGSVSDVELVLNQGGKRHIKGLDLQEAQLDMTTVYGWASAPQRDVLGIGHNELIVNINGGATITYVIEVGPEVKTVLDVQIIVFDNSLQPRNTVTTDGFQITVLLFDENETIAKSVIEEAEPDPALFTTRSAPAVVPHESGDDITFALAATDDKATLYVASNNGSGDGHVALTYYYLFEGQSTTDTLTLSESYDSTGAYVFSDEDVDPNDLLAELNGVLTREPTTFSRVAWRHASDTYDIVASSTAYAVPTNATLQIGTWQLELRRNTRISLDIDAPAIKFDKASGEESILVQIVENDLPQPVGTRPTQVVLPLSGNHRGTLTFAWDWSHYELGQQYAGLQRIFYGPDAAGADAAQYPLFTPASDPGPIRVKDLFFNVYLQPLAPLNDLRTRMALDLSKQSALISHYLSSTTNAPVSITPAVPKTQDLTGGFGFAKNTGAEESDRYLCPVGEFEVGSGDGLTSEERVQIRSGLAGTEYVLVEPGDRLVFEAGKPAFATSYDPQNGTPTTLDDALTTSWIRVLKQSTLDAAAGVEVVDTSYCAQASSSTYFGRELDKAKARYEFPIAVGASLLQFQQANQDVAFPMLPYGGVFYSDEDEGIVNPNANLSAEELSAIERQVVSPDRRNTLQPHFSVDYGPIFFDTSTNLAFDGGYARTPLGLLAELNPVDGGTPPAGTIKNLILARSPQNPDQLLQLTSDEDSNGVVNPTFSNTVLNDSLFLVATDQAAFEPFPDKDIKLGDFTFDVQMGNADNQAVSIFKFVPGVTARELIEDDNTWTTLIQDGATKSDVQARLLAYVKAADDGGDLFDAFRKTIDDPNWNGILVFNCPLKYDELPLDIQILLGGIKGQLLAHHFGITINRVEDMDSVTSVQHSSLFSVINYDSAKLNPPYTIPESPPTEFPDFRVLLLNVQYANSKLAVFDSQIAFSIKELFGSSVTLQPGPVMDYPEYGTIVIDGVYTLFEDGTGSLLFSTKDERSFVYDDTGDTFTALVAQSITEATLVPVTRRDGTDDCKVIAASAFRISGLLAFKDNIAGDLFSYGEVADNLPTKGLAITDYGFDMTTCIKADNTADLVDGIPTNLTGIKVDQMLSEARDHSFERTFPGTIEAVVRSPDGLTPSEIGEWQVKTGSGTNTGAPRYSLQFEVPLGTFGMLASFKTDLTATLLIGWDPETTDPDKQVGVILRLPPEISGPKGFMFEGVIASDFEYVQLDRFEFGETTYVSMLRFMHFQSMLLNFFLSYGVGPKDLGIFGAPGDPGGRNSLFWIGKSTDTNWDGPTISVTLVDVPQGYLGRSFEIKTDPTNPNVITEVFNQLNLMTDKTVEQVARLIFANLDLYNSDAGIAFALQFKYQSLKLTTVLIDSSFYGLQINITPQKKKDPDDGGGGTGGGGKELVASNGTAVLADDDKEDDEGGFLGKVKGFTFTIIYRKVSDEVGVYSADIYLDLGTIPLGAVMLSLPNFSISIWTNGDWRFAVGWPFTGATAHPITVQFQAGPLPLIVKAGFYLGKLSSAAAPDQFSTEFNLIWTFGLGIAGGVGKEFEKGPLKAGASLMLGCTIEGFLASFDGKMTQTGVDYWWWGVSLSLTGNVFGKVDFEIIAVDVSLTISLTVAFAIETAHSSPLKLTAEVVAKASVKIVFVKISFSFKAKLDLIDTVIGNGSAVAKLSGPTPTAVNSGRPLEAQDLREAMAIPGQAPWARLSKGVHTRRAEDKTQIDVGFVLQPTAIATNDSTENWAPQGVATLVLESGGLNSPFGVLASELSSWLIDAYGGASTTFHEQLVTTETALQSGEFDRAAILAALSETFIFNIGKTAFAADTAVVSMAMPDSLGLEYNGGKVMNASLRDSIASFGHLRLPSNYSAIVAAYFGGGDILQASERVEESTAGLVFDEYFNLLGQQVIQLLIETGAPDLATALSEISIDDLGGFVSRFLMGGVRLPDPNDTSKLEALYVLTGQQFPLAKKDDAWVLNARLTSTPDTPEWVKVADDATSSLEPSMVHTSGPVSPPWTVGPLRALVEKPLIFPMNNINKWSDGEDEYIISVLSEDVVQSVRDWRKDNGATTGPWLVNQLFGGEADADQQTDLSTGGTPWEADSALVLPIRLASIPDPDAVEPGAILVDTFSLLGTDEANRAMLQALLDEIDAGNEAVNSINLLVSESRGNWASAKTPRVLVRTDLSTVSTPAGVAAAEAVAEANTGVESDPTPSLNWAKPGEGGVQFARFLRLTWEVSVVHSSGFYLQVEGLDLNMFQNGPADLALVVQFGSKGSITPAAPYQNALIGSAPENGKAIFSTLAENSEGTPVQGYTAAYAGGSVGWSITWDNAPDEADAGSGDFLQGLYQMVSYRIKKINGTAQPNANWSRPINANDESGADADTVTWIYSKAFETAQLVGSDNRYGAVDDVFTVRISIEDVFGNSVPASLMDTTDLKVVYNDDLMGLADWSGTQVYYAVEDKGGVQLGLRMSFDPSTIQDSEGKVNAEQLQVTTQAYAKIYEQLTDQPNTSAAVDTGGTLAPTPLGALTSGASVISGLVGYVKPLLDWLRAGGSGDAPAPVTLAMPLDKSQPANWAGDLQELVVSLVLQRANVSDEIADKAPEVRLVNSPLQPVEDTGEKADPSGLTSFADKFETAYYPFDDKVGVVKVATGQNSDITSQRFGRRSIWLQRWGKGVGTEVEIVKGDDGKPEPIFYAPTPLSRQLITRDVPDLKDYGNPSGSEKGYDLVNRIFNSTDMDQWGALFLTTVETIFSPIMAPAVADHSSREDELYDPFVQNKETLAGSISDKITYVYDEPDGTGDPKSAKETWRQALLRTLANDYGFSTLTQLEAIVNLNGSIEPNGDSTLPPQLYGAVQVPGQGDPGTLPYALTPSTLPLVQTTADHKNWLNFLASASDPEAQRAFNLDLNYEVNQLEHQRDGQASDRGYVPSSWLTFVLQQNPGDLPQAQENTLTQPIGETRIPIPLRSYPPLPKLLSTKAQAKTTVSTIQDALVWDYELQVERSAADQDTLNLSLTFNQLQTTTVPGSAPDAALLAANDGRDPPNDLFDALARFVYEYPQLQPKIEQLPADGGAESVNALKDFSSIIAGVAATWSSWHPPEPHLGGLNLVEPDDDTEVWHFEIQNVESNTDLQVKAAWSRASGTPPWPTIMGYTFKSASADVAIYSPDGGKSERSLTLQWNDLYVLDYQNVLPSAFTERNRNLAVPPQQTNPDFVYRTETVAWPTPIVPLNSAPDQIDLDPKSTLAEAIEALFVSLTTPPADSVQNGTNPPLETESSIAYRYEVMANNGSSAYSILPVFLVAGKVDPGDEKSLAGQIASNLSNWQSTTGAQSPDSSLKFLLTVFATTIVADNDRLPLVQFQELVIPVPKDSADWW